MNKKLKIYSVLMAIVLVGSAITLTFNYESYSYDKRDGEVLTLDSLKEEFAKVDRKTVVNVDTTGGKRDTIGTSSSWTVQFKPTFEVTVPVRPIRGANDKFLYSSVKGEPCMVEMQKVKLKVPFEKASPDYILTNTLLSCATLPLLIAVVVCYAATAYLAAGHHPEGDTFCLQGRNICVADCQTFGNGRLVARSLLVLGQCGGLHPDTDTPQGHSDGLLRHQLRHLRPRADDSLADYPEG